MSDFPYVRFSLYQNESHIKVQIFVVQYFKVVERGDRDREDCYCVYHAQRQKRLDRLSNFETVMVNIHNSIRS